MPLTTRAPRTTTGSCAGGGRRGTRRLCRNALGCSMACNTMIHVSTLDIDCTVLTLGDPRFYCVLSSKGNGGPIGGKRVTLGSY